MSGSEGGMIEYMTYPGTARRNVTDRGVSRRNSL
jgi:hypothetical protein